MNQSASRIRIALALPLLALTAALVCVGFCAPRAAYAQADAATAQLASGNLSLQYADRSHSVSKGTITVSGLEKFGGVSEELFEPDAQQFYFEVDFAAGDTVTFTSSNPAVASVQDGYESYTSVDWNFFRPYFIAHSVGTAVISISNGKDTVQVPVVVYPSTLAKVTSIKKASYKTVRIAWKPAANVSGYLVKRAPVNDYGAAGDYVTVETQKGAAASSATIDTPWDQDYSYYVVPFVQYGSEQFSGGSTWNMTMDYKLPKAAVKWVSLKKSGAKNRVLKWSADAGAKQFVVQRSANENSGFKRIGTTAGRTFTDKKAAAGVTYYYRIVASYPGRGTIATPSRGLYVSAKTSAASKAVSLGNVSLGTGAYDWNWAHPDNVMYYYQKSKLYVVCHVGSSLKIYGFNAKMDKVSTKTVKLPKHDCWGGVYHGPDGNNYVAIGYKNLKQSKSKTVIKVIKYSNAWKKGKTASISGSASNGFDGIYLPFQAGSASFDMQGSKLYLLTCREMFATEDGLHHQSNIAFSIDTKTMKAKTDNVAYISHSFNQRVRFKDGSIYIADHGDAYDRGMCLTWQDAYGTSAASSKTALPFAFMGSTGLNYTGATMGGMEVGSSNILVCGTSQPHNYKVAGVKGFSNYKQNVFVTVTNRTTGKSSVKWLTSINPRKGAQSVSEARMEKIDDNRFAVLYGIYGKSKKPTARCVVIDGNGKKLSTKSYSNMTFAGGSQPILANGSIYWADGASGKTKLNRVPVS